MVCVYCGSKTQVVNSRHQLKINQVWRRRKCCTCQAVFTSEEAPTYDLAWIVYSSKYVTTFEPFSRDKLFLSIYRCCEHRSDPISDARGLTDTVMNKLAQASIPDTVHTLDNKEIAGIVLVALNRFDRASAVRYESLHEYLRPADYYTMRYIA